MFESGLIGIVLIIGVILFVVFSTYGKKQKEKKYIRIFHDRVQEYIYQQKILNPFIIYNDLEASSDIPREIMRKLNAFDYIDKEVKKAKLADSMAGKAEKRDISGKL